MRTRAGNDPLAPHDEIAAAHYLGVSENTIDRLRAAGEITDLRVAGAVRIRGASLAPDVDRPRLRREELHPANDPYRARPRVRREVAKATSFRARAASTPIAS